MSSKLFDAIADRIAEHETEQHFKNMIIGMALENAGGVMQFKLEEGTKLSGGFTIDCDGEMLTVTKIQDNEMGTMDS